MQTPSKRQAAGSLLALLLIAGTIKTSPVVEKSQDPALRAEAVEMVRRRLIPDVNRHVTLERPAAPQIEVTEFVVEQSALSLLVAKVFSEKFVGYRARIRYRTNGAPGCKALKIDWVERLDRWVVSLARRPDSCEGWGW